VSDDRGSASVFALLVIPVLCLAAFGLLAFAQQALIRQQLRTAADLSALAAAQALDDPCQRAQHIAEAHRVSLLACASVGGDWTVEVSAPQPPVMRRMAALFGRGLPDHTQVATAGYSDPASST
jgi:secretion/DNA translocation related TadE-like protein